MKKYGVTAEYLESRSGRAISLRTSPRSGDEARHRDARPLGVDAINVLKQSYEIGLKKKTKIWFNWMTNVFGSGVPADALEGVYSSCPGTTT